MPDQIIDIVKEAITNRTSLNIVGGNSKAFYGRQVLSKKILKVAAYQGIVSYEPTELVVTARCGTRLSELEKILAEQQQMLPFEPPHFAESATVGGMVACGFSGPARPYAGSVRDYVLGVRCINGKGEDLSFGGQVMKNVAGFDVSRLMTGALGTLGVILEASFKLLPKPEAEITLQFEKNQQQAVVLMNQLAGKAIPVSAACFDSGKLRVRLSGFSSAIFAAHKKIGGELINNADGFWYDLKEHKNEFFSSQQPLWRIAVPSTSAPLDLEGEMLIDWGGAQRWLTSDSSADEIREKVRKAGGHATLFRIRNTNQHDHNMDIFSPLSPALHTIHKRLKNSFDPKGIFNPRRMYPDL